MTDPGTLGLRGIVRGLIYEHQSRYFLLFARSSSSVTTFGLEFAGHSAFHRLEIPD